jgi:two-component system, OmpR family, response regulator QseB
MRLLVVEDDAQLGEAPMLGLRQLGYAVDWFRDGAPADAALGSAPYDAMVLDLGLPGGDGIVWLTRWRGQGQVLPVLILTARDGVQQRVAGLDAGADDYLIKPVSLDELAARLRALLRRASGRAQSVWQHGTLEYDPAAKRVRWQDRPVELTSRELAVLELLMANPQRVLSKEFLMNKLYDWSGGEPESNTLEVHVHNLRRKLAPAVVRTVRGLGYALGSCESEHRPAP